MQGANLYGAFFDNVTSLKKVILADKKHGGVSLADISWGDVNLAVVDWSALKMLGDEYEARRPIRGNGSMRKPTDLPIVRKCFSGRCFGSK